MIPDHSGRGSSDVRDPCARAASREKMVFIIEQWSCAAIPLVTPYPDLPALFVPELGSRRLPACLGSRDRFSTHVVASSAFSWDGLFGSQFN
jgi:hypothetical protein